MQTKSITDAYTQYIELRAGYEGISQDAVKDDITPSQFDATIHDLYARYMNREFTIGKPADLLHVPSLNLVDLLETLDLPIRYS